MASSAAQINPSKILSSYRTLTRMIKHLPPNQKPERQLKELRETIHKNASLTDPIEIKACVQQLGEKIAYFRIITPKQRLTKANDEGNGTKRWIYGKDGPVQVEGNISGRKNGKVVSNFDGKNLDPCAVKTHNGQLKRMGFMNNLHAKGLF